MSSQPLARKSRFTQFNTDNKASQSLSQRQRNIATAVHVHTDIPCPKRVYVKKTWVVIGIMLISLIVLLINVQLSLANYDNVGYVANKVANKDDNYLETMISMVHYNLNNEDYKSLLLDEYKSGSRDKYFIPNNYTIRKDNDHYDDREQTDLYQKEVYVLLRSFMFNMGMNTVIDIGCGSAYKLIKYISPYFTTIGYETEPSISYLREQYPNNIWVESGKPDKSFPASHQNINKSDIIISADVIEHILDPDELIKFMLSFDSSYFLISTPRREEKLIWDGPPKNKAHVREWTFHEFQMYLNTHFNVIKSYVGVQHSYTQLHLCQPLLKYNNLPKSYKPMQPNGTNSGKNTNNNNSNNNSNKNNFNIGKIALTPAEIDGLVYTYLKSRGYQSALNALASDSSADLHLTDDQILASKALHIITDKHKTMLHSIYGYTHSDNNIEWFDDSYQYLYLWVNQCLDCYRIELQPITYPIFIHFIFELLLKSQVGKAQDFYYKYNKEHNTLHAEDLGPIYELIETIDINKNNKNNAKDKESASGAATASKSRIQSYPIYQRYRKHKYQITLSVVSHNLFMSWLNSSKLNLLIKTVNNHIAFKIVSYSSQSQSQPHSHALNLNINKEKISWGIARYLDQIETKALGDNNNKYNPNKSRLIRTEFCEIHASQPKYCKEDEKLIHNEIKNRVYAGADRLPSICCYKFINGVNNISCSNVSSNGQWIVVGCNDSKIKLFDVAAATGKSANSFDQNNVESKQENEYVSSTPVNTNNNLHCNNLIGHKSSITALSFYPDNDFFVSSSCDNTVRLWSCENGGECLSFYRGHCFPIWDVSFSPLGLYFATGSHDKTARLWSTDRGVPLRIFAGHIADVECVEFHPNCNYIVSGSSDRTIRCWDIQSGNCVRLFSGHLGSINHLQFTTDGRCVVSASSDKTIRIWDIATSQCIKILNGHTNQVRKIAVAHSVNRNAVIIDHEDNKNSNSHSSSNTNISSFPLVISAGMDNSVRFWDVNNIQKPLIKTIQTNICISHLTMTKSNLLMLAGTV